MNRGNTSAQPDLDALREEITRTRSELGETVGALAARTDVRTRARASAQRTAARFRTGGGSPAPWLLVTGAAAAVLAVVLLRRRRL